MRGLNSLIFDCMRSLCSTLTLFIICTFLTGLHAQPARYYKYFIKYSGELVDTEADADYIRLLQANGSDGSFVEKYKNGKLRRSGNTSGFSIDYNVFSLQGLVVSYFPNGEIARVTNYNNNKVVGNDSCYYVDGRLYMVRQYKYTPGEDVKGSIPTIVSLYDRQGKQLIKDGNGHFQTTGQDFFSLYNDLLGNQVNVEQGECIDGLKSGTWTGNMITGTFTEFYDRGRLKQGRAKYFGLNDSVTYNAVYSPPAYKSGIREFYDDLIKSFQYPGKAKRKHFGGTVLLSFTINTFGYPENIDLMADPGMDIGDAVVQALLSLPPWTPGKVRDYPVSVSYVVPVEIMPKD